MVLKKRQYCGFTDFHVPSVPRAPRSARGRGLHKKKVNDSQICAFELLASLAGKLLQESESSASSNASEANVQLACGDSFIKKERDEDLPLKTEYRDQGSCKESASIPEFDSPRRDQKCILEELPHAESDSVPEHSSIITNSDSLDKVRSDLKPAICKRKITSETFPCKLERSPDSAELSNCNADNRFNRQQGGDKLETGGSVVKNYCSSKSSADLCMKNPALLKSDNNYKLSSCRSAVPSASVLGHRSGVKLGVRYDDENFSRFNKTNNKPKSYRLPSRIGDRRIRKLLTSKYWKAGPKLKDYELSKDYGIRPLYHKRKMCYGRERYQQDALYKRRKLSARRLVVNSDGGFSCESVCNSPEKGMNAEKNGPAAVFHGGNEVSSPVIDHHMPFRPDDCHVKLSIKSIRVPELFIEVPETTTVGSLKRIVMDAVTTILGGGLRVGVVLHGKKVRDDNRTLLQTGIACKENLDSLGFTLEPTPVQASTLLCAENAPGLQCDTSQLVLRSPATPVVDSGISEALPEPSLPSNSGNITENKHNSESSQTCMAADIAHLDSKALVAVPPNSAHTDIVLDETHPDSKALVAIPPVNDAQALAVVPVNQKSKRTELVQRRTRRPFSVSEVEALVQAVEELGTGRWRDVKLRSFENADHRTYVDLKDKWKTLVHTAKISPQQRRGEPVPQELLDRVLAAHAYWSQNQVKQHNNKNHQTGNKITEAHADRNGN